MLTSCALLQTGLWVFIGVSQSHKALSRVLSCCFLAAVSLVAATGFLVYGGRLFLMLRRSGTQHAGPHVHVFMNHAYSLHHQFRCACQ